jgi:hypothetical protein
LDGRAVIIEKIEEALAKGIDIDQVIVLESELPGNEPITEKEFRQILNDVVARVFANAKEIQRARELLRSNNYS